MLRRQPAGHSAVPCAGADSTTCNLSRPRLPEAGGASYVVQAQQQTQQQERRYHHRSSTNHRLGPRRLKSANNNKTFPTKSHSESKRQHPTGKTSQSGGNEQGKSSSTPASTSGCFVARYIESMVTPFSSLICKWRPLMCKIPSCQIFAFFLYKSTKRQRESKSKYWAKINKLEESYVLCLVNKHFHLSSDISDVMGGRDNF